jgi:glycosyltransferase involved in cell wall biosynthesis
MTKVSVIIPSLAHKNEDYLKLCVESLRATTDWDIIVVTNGSKDKPNLSHIKGISTHIHTRDQGQCIAVNIGAQVVAPDTDFIFISNDDMYYAPYWDRHIWYDYACFSPNLVEPNNNAGSAKPFLKIDGGFTLEEFDQGTVDDFIAERTDRDVLEGDESGFNFPVFIRKDLWDTIGGYDVAYDPWGSNSDTDLQTRINLAGINPMRYRDVLVYHFSNKSGTFDGTHQDFYQNNIEYFKDKFGFDRDELDSDVWYNKDILPTDKSKIKFQAPWVGKYEDS